MRKALKYWLLSGLIATTMVVGDGEVRASVVFSQPGHSLDAGADDDLRQWLDMPSNASGGTLTSSLLVINAPQEQDALSDDEPEELDDLLTNSPLGMTAVPGAFVPIRFPITVLSSVPASETKTPCPPLLAIVFPSIVFPDAPSATTIPSSKWPKACPAAFTPTKLP